MLRSLLLLRRLELQHQQEEEEEEEDRLVVRSPVGAVRLVLLVAEMAAVVRHAPPQQVLPGGPAYSCEQQGLELSVRQEADEVARETKQQQVVVG